MGKGLEGAKSHDIKAAAVQGHAANVLLCVCVVCVAWRGALTPPPSTTQHNLPRQPSNWPKPYICDRSSPLLTTTCVRAVGLSCFTLIIGGFSRDYHELRFKNTMIPLP